MLSLIIVIMKKNLFQKAIEKFKEEQKRKEMETLLSQCKEEQKNLLEKIRKELFPKLYEETKEEVKKKFVKYLKTPKIDDKDIKVENDKVKALNRAIELSIKQLENHILEIRIKVNDKKFRIISTLKGLEPKVKAYINKSPLEICEERKKELEQIVSGQSSIVYVLELENKHPPMVMKDNFDEILKLIIDEQN